MTPVPPPDTDLALMKEKSVDLEFVSPEPSIIGPLIQIVLPILLLIGFFIWMQRRAQGQMSGIMSIGRSRAKTYSSERPASIRPATRLPGPNKRVSVRPAVRLPEARRGTLALVDPAHAASTLKDRRLWTFASGSAFGALVCVSLFWWLTTSEQPRAEPFVRAPESVPAPVSPVESEMPSVA